MAGPDLSALRPRGLCVKSQIVHSLALLLGKCAIRRKPLPLNRCKRIPLQTLQQFLINSLAIRAIRHNHNPHLFLIEANRIIPPPVVTPFLKKRLPMSRPIQPPGQPITQPHLIVPVSRLSRKGRELVQRRNSHLRAQHQLPSLASQSSPIHHRPHKLRKITDGRLH
jgi:hypothetical protein